MKFSDLFKKVDAVMCRGYTTGKDTFDFNLKKKNHSLKFSQAGKIQKLVFNGKEGLFFGKNSGIGLSVSSSYSTKGILEANYKIKLPKALKGFEFSESFKFTKEKLLDSETGFGLAFNSKEVDVSANLKKKFEVSAPYVFNLEAIGKLPSYNLDVGFLYKAELKKSGISEKDKAFGVKIVSNPFTICGQVFKNLSKVKIGVNWKLNDNTQLAILGIKDLKEGMSGSKVKNADKQKIGVGVEHKFEKSKVEGSVKCMIDTTMNYGMVYGMKITENATANFAFTGHLLKKDEAKFGMKVNFSE